MKSPAFWLIGVGGLGCPAALGLSAAGVGGIAIVDHDLVEASNLQRQILFSIAEVGMPKVDAARLRLHARCPALHVESVRRRLQPADVPGFVAALPPAAVVLECTDSPALKFAFNDACLGRGVPLVIGAALGLQAQVLAVLPGHACYRCIYEAPPLHPPRSCESAGVLGPSVGLAGFLMASVAVAMASGKTEAAGRLITFDSLRAQSRTLRPYTRPGCTACGAREKRGPYGHDSHPPCST